MSTITPSEPHGGGPKGKLLKSTLMHYSRMTMIEAATKCPTDGENQIPLFSFQKH